MYCAGSTPCCPHRSISTRARLEHLHFPRPTRAHKGRESMEHLKRTFAPPARRLASRMASRRTSRSQPCRCSCRPRALPLRPRPKRARVPMAAFVTRATARGKRSFGKRTKTCLAQPCARRGYLAADLATSAGKQTTAQTRRALAAQGHLRCHSGGGPRRNSSDALPRASAVASGQAAPSAPCCCCAAVALNALGRGWPKEVPSRARGA